MTKARKRNVLLIGMMAASILLLVLLQFFWLKNSYSNTQADLRREVNIIFREAVMNMWDSIVAKSIRSIPADSAGRTFDILRDARDSSIAIAKIENNVVRRGAGDSSSLRIVFSTRDSTMSSEVLKPLAGRLREHHDRDPNRTFIIQMASDTLDRKKLENKLRHALADNNIEADFRLHTTIHAGIPPADLAEIPRSLIVRKRREPASLRTTSAIGVITEPVSLTPLHEYYAELINIRPLLLRRIGPEIFFSVVLTTFTASAFLLMFRSIRKQQQLVSAKNDFINNVTHELKTPVATVSVALEALQNFNAADNPQLSKEYLEIARRELRRLNEITDRILKTSVLENEATITTGTCDLNDIIRNVSDDMKIILDQRNAKISFEKDGSDFQLHCDRYQLYQVVENLVDNALKYSSDHPRIEIHLTGHPKLIELKIRDHGIGISKEYQEKIFEKFFRVPSGDVHTIKGYGLGLNYVYQFVKSMGGSIAVESAESQGTTFSLKFPRIKTHKISVKIGNGSNG